MCVDNGWTLYEGQVSPVIFIFVPVMQISKVTCIPRSAPVVMERVMGHADILNAFSDTCPDECTGSELDSTSVTRLIELRVTRGVERNEVMPGTDINQHRTSVVAS